MERTLDPEGGLVALDVEVHGVEQIQLLLRHLSMGCVWICVCVYMCVFIYVCVFLNLDVHGY